MDTFETLQKEFFEATLKRHPQLASLLGYTHLDTEMPSGKLVDRQKEIEENKNFLEQFRTLSESHLDLDQKITRRLAIHKLQLSLFVDETLEHYMKNPNAATEVSFALSSLLRRKNADKFYPLLERLEKTPQYITDFKTRVKTPVRLWTTMALGAAQQLTASLHSIVITAKKEVPHYAEDVETCIKKVEKSLVEYCCFLQKILPTAQTSWAMDKKTFDTLLQLRKLPYTGDEILYLGQKWLKEERKRQKMLAELIAPGTSIKNVTALVKGMHPLSFEKVLQLYKDYMKKARQFVIDNDILTLPDKETLLVDVTPRYLRQLIPIALYQPAPAAEPEKVGYLRATPPEDPAMLKEHNESAIMNTVVHEGYPGHHIQIHCSNIHPHRLRWFTLPPEVYAKIVSGGTELMEGWAVYCEELMMEKGFCTTKEYQFIQSQYIIFRAVRMIVDVQLSRGEMTLNEAVAFLEKEVGMEHTAAAMEVKRYTISPSYALSYLLGKHMIKELKEKVKTMMGPSFTDKFFHDTLVYGGSMPIALVEDMFTSVVDCYC